MPKHKVFISYHHKNDSQYINLLRNKYGQNFLDCSVDTGDIHDSKTDEQIRQIIRDEYIRDATVTIVLIGQDTWGRKHVDWEISSSIRDTKHNPRNGILGIILPTNNNYYSGKSLKDPNTIPARLYKNFTNGFAQLYYWRKDMDLEKMIHQAFKDRNTKNPDNTDALRRRNSN